MEAGAGGRLARLPPRAVWLTLALSGKRRGGQTLGGGDCVGDPGVGRALRTWAEQGLASQLLGNLRLASPRGVEVLPVGVVGTQNSLEKHEKGHWRRLHGVSRAVLALGRGQGGGAR